MSTFDDALKAAHDAGARMSDREGALEWVGTPSAKIVLRAALPIVAQALRDESRNLPLHANEGRQAYFDAAEFVEGLGGES